MPFDPPLVSTSLIPSLLPEALEPPLYSLLPVTRAFLVALQKGWRMKDAKGGTIGYEEFNSDRSMRLNYLLREMAKSMINTTIIRSRTRMSS